ncbi:SDR family NAD(P)-dependent oxidoreductase [Microvirga tunisiensis]|jgi:NAD(P)-dependent dehydrogenase (short-subunit alcohol dehydrogenase family)|uniref:SDR family oxidoreductase n=1 Tax=Microvirga tunisiensis TaxID=2108360 RepID=A0A5N7MPW0_9HYPH|nr:SDR family oxidoreductase [Microvirga tunisiensis]MPR10883.1 SDR family oxidoreductase [Microvirga tunisiensis]MPR29035.1 SDR family oxidoreductase [Microvirga tunisiensis]
MSIHSELIPRVTVEGAVYPSLKGKGVLITGGGSGIGASLVEHFCTQGARVGFIELNSDTADETARRIGAATGNPPHHEAVDLRDIGALRTAISSLSERIGPVRVLVNNAGNDDRMPLENVTPEYWDERFQTNLRHQFFAAQAVIGDMARAGGGSIINMGSISWMRGAAGLIFYTTAKSAVMGMTKSLAREVGERNIRVNSIAPGWVLTERQVERAKRIYHGKFAEYLEVQCLKEHLLPPDIARMALWLAADDSRLVTAQTFIVDAGVV